MRPGYNFDFLNDNISNLDENIYCMGYNFEEACASKYITAENKKQISKNCIKFVRKVGRKNKIKTSEKLRNTKENFNNQWK